MKFIVSSPLLLKSLQAISGVLSTHNTLPILDNFLFELEKDELTITTSDLETTMSIKLNVSKSVESGSIAIPARILMDILKTFSDVPLTFSVNKETFGIEINAGEGKYKLVGAKSDVYPKTPTLDNTSLIELNSQVIAQALNKTIFATGNDEYRPVMSGVYCQLAPEGMIFVATDAHKLVRYKRADAVSEKVASFILPKKPLNQLKNLLMVEDTSVQMKYNQTNAFFAFKNIQLVCRLIEGKYPNYEAVIPTENPNKLSIERLPFLNSIKRVSLFASQSTYQIRLNISGRELLLSSEDVDFSNEAKERLTCNYEGADMEIGFNSKFLIEILNNLSSDEIKIEMSEPNRAGIITPVNNENKDEDILMLVMPVMLNS